MSTNKKTLIDGDFQVGSNHFIVDTENNYVGFNNATPQNKIDVQVGPRTGTHSTDRPLYVTGVTTTSGAEFVSDDGTTGIGIGSSNIFTKGTNQNLTIAPNGTGAVGINTATPNPLGETFRVWIDGDAKATGNVTASYIYGDGSGLWNVPGTQWVSSSEDIYFLNNTGSGEGKVGIGKTSPEYKLDILDSDKPTIRVKSSSTGDGDALLILDSSATGESDIDFMHDGALNWRIRTGDEAASGTTFQINNSSDSDVLTIQQNGNVGIGTSSPGVPFEVSKSAGGELLRLTNGTSTLYAGVDADPPWFGTSTDDHLRLMTNGTEKVRIESDGSVGVGTMAPHANLHVVGNTYVSSNFEVGEANLYVNTTNSRVGVGTTAPHANLHVVGNTYVSSNFEVGQANLYVDTVNSRVGVGTTNPSRTLHIYAPSTESSVPLLVQSENQFCGMFLVDDTGSVQLQNNRGALRFLVDGDENLNNQNEVLRITNDGRFGFGTSDPDISRIFVNAAPTSADTSWSGLYIDYNSNGTETLTANRAHRGIYIDMDGSASGGDTTNEHRMYGIVADVRNQGDSDLLYGADFYTRSEHTTGTLTNHRAVNAFAYASGAGITTNLTAGYFYALKYVNSSDLTSNMVGVHGEVEVDTGGVANAYAFRAFVDRDGGTISNSYLYYGQHQGDDTGVRWGMYLTGEEKNYFSNRISIGTGEEGGMLNIGGGSINIYDSTTPDARAVQFYQDDGTTQIGFMGPGSSSNSNMYFYARTDNDVVIGAGNSERIRVLANGNVGIGVNDPDTKLEVNGAIKCGGNSYIDSVRMDRFGSGVNTIFDFECPEDDDAVIFRFRNKQSQNGVTTWAIVQADTQDYSDDRLKINESHLTNSLDTIMKLKPQRYQKYGDLPENYPLEKLSDAKLKEEVGFIAQQIYYEVPELRHMVTPASDANPTDTLIFPDDPTQDPDYSSWGTEAATIRYNEVIPYNTAAIQELKKLRDSDLERITTLETQVMDLLSRVHLLEST